MYFSTNNFPEFEGKSKEYRKGCLNYCLSKTHYNKRFWFTVVLLLGVTYFISPFLGPYGAYIALINGIVFIVYLLIEINKSMHPAVKRYSHEYKN